MTYSKTLAKRFIDDYDLPIPNVNKEEYFNYYLNLFEKDYGTLTKYNELVSLIDNKFNGVPNNFLDEYYRVRENMVQHFLNSQAYFDFCNKLDLKKFAINDRPDVTSNNIFNQNNIGKYFISVDLKKANFQALKYANKDIVLNTNTYNEFVNEFTDIDYIKYSKHFRQVVFGKKGASRQITIEKYILNEVRKRFENNINMGCLKLVSMSNDELVYELIEYDAEEDFNAKLIWKSLFTIISNEIKECDGFDVRLELFNLKGYNLVFKQSQCVSKTFYFKNCIVGKSALKTVPLPFFSIVYKLFNKMELCDTDYHFTYEGMDAVLNEEFEVVEIKN